MSRRLDIELTSKREDGSWTWRAAGAREPKGVVESHLVPAGSNVKDTLRAEVETDLDGTRVLSIQNQKQKQARTGLLEFIPNDKPFEPVTQTSSKSRGPGDKKRGPRRDTPRSGERPGHKGGDRPNRERRPARPRFEAPPELPQRPKPKRIRPDRVHRDAVLAELPEAHRHIAEKVLVGGVPAVRSAIDEQNSQAVAAGQEKIEAAGLVQLAEQMLPKLRVAEWLDRAEAAQKIVSEIDVRDLRAIVVGANDPVIVRDDATRVLADAMKAALAARLEEETRNWLDDIKAATDVGRVARALKMSSQPPKAGVRFPQNLAVDLAAKTTEALSMDAPAERWIILLEAAAFSPIRSLVTPAAPSSQVSPELTKTVMRLGPLMPQIAALYGVEVDPKAPAPRPLRPVRNDKGQKKPRGNAVDGNKGPRRSSDANSKGPRRTPEAPVSAAEPTSGD